MVGEGQAAVPAPAGDPLLARDVELDRLVELLDDARAGDGRHLVIEGEAGIGKSRLLRELGAVARRSGFRVLTARADPLSTDVAFGVVLELLEPLASTSGAEHDALFAGAAGLVLPLLAADRPGTPADAAERFAHGAFRLFANAAAARPLLVLVDDVQWADRGTLRVLAHVAARLDGQPLGLVAALRRGEPAGDPAGLDRFRFEPPAAVLVPRPLPAGAVARLAAAAGIEQASAQACDACLRATGGNPLLLKQLLTSLAARGAPLEAGALDEADVAHGVAEIARHVDAQLSRLSPLAGEIARAAAILGDGAALRHAARLAGADLDSAATAADRLLAAGLLAQVDPLAFAHPVVRESLHAHLPPATRARLHGAAARQLAVDRVDPERVAAHVVRSLPSGESDAVELLRAAAVQARARAVPESAIHYLRRALEEPPADWQLGETLFDLGRAEAAAGLPEAAATLNDALAQLGPAAERAEALLWIGRARFAAGALREAAEAFDRGLAELRRLPEARQAEPGTRELATELNAGFISAARFETSLQPEAQRRLAPLLETRLEGSTRGERALLAEVALESGIRGVPPADAIAIALRAWAGGRVLDELDAQGIVLSQLAATLTWSDALEESEQVLGEAVAHAERTGAAHGLATASYLRAWPRYYCGELAGAERDARRALGTPGWEMFEPSARAVVALVALEHGDPLAAERALAVPDAAQRWAGSIPYALLLEAQGRLALTRGDAAAARSAFEGCGELIGAMGTRHPFCQWRSQQALAHHALGEREPALALAREEAELARALGLARPLGGALRVLGQVTGGEEGVALLREAVAATEASPARLEHVRSLLELGVGLHGAGEREAARAPLLEALDLAAALGATALEERARVELVATGLRPRRSATSGVGALTASERRIARLAADGLSNREIAREAVVVPKTVQFHLSNAYRKLGIGGRDELAAALRAERRG